MAVFKVEAKSTNEDKSGHIKKNVTFGSFSSYSLQDYEHYAEPYIIPIYSTVLNRLIELFQASIDKYILLTQLGDL